MSWENGRFVPGGTAGVSLPIGTSGSAVSKPVTVQDLINIGLVDPGVASTGGKLFSPSQLRLTAAINAALSSIDTAIDLMSSGAIKKMNGNAGVVIGSLGITGYNSAGTQTFFLDAETGAITIVGPALGAATGTSLTLSGLTATRVIFAGFAGLLSDASTLTFDSATGMLSATKFNALTLTAIATGFTIAGGTTSKTLTVPLDASVSGTNTGDQSLAGLQTSDPDLTAISALTGTGFARRTAADTWELNAWGLVKRSVDAGETMTIPSGYQAIFAGDFTNSGVVINSGNRMVI